MTFQDPCKLRQIQGRQQQQGLNLVELAIVLVILGVLLGGLITPFSTQLEASKRKGVETQLKDIHDALLGYVANTGRLPCPATATSNGLSAPVGATTNCTSPNGFVPIRTLDLNGSVDASNRLLDPWLNPIRYRLTTAAGGAYSNDITLGLTPDLQICQQSACSNIIADNVVAVIVSLGSDGTTTTSTDQLENIDNDVIFVERSISELGGSEFDDHLRWISPNTLAYQLVKSGQLD